MKRKWNALRLKLFRVWNKEKQTINKFLKNNNKNSGDKWKRTHKVINRGFSCTIFRAPWVVNTAPRQSIISLITLEEAKKNERKTRDEDTHAEDQDEVRKPCCPNSPLKLCSRIHYWYCLSAVGSNKFPCLHIAAHSLGHPQ